MLTGVMAGVTITPILTVGDELPGGFRFEAIPDGISVLPRARGRVDLYVNHETSKVPFPYVTANPTAANSESDFDNSQVSRLSLNAAGRVLDGSFAIDSGGGFQPGRSTNGRVWKMVLDPEDPTQVTSLSIVVEGDDNPVKTLGEIHQPDNIETTKTGLLVTEDPGSSQQSPQAPRTPPPRRLGCGTSRSRVRLRSSRRSISRPMEGRPTSGPLPPATPRSGTGAPGR